MYSRFLPKMILPLLKLKSLKQKRILLSGCLVSLLP